MRLETALAKWSTDDINFNLLNKLEVSDKVCKQGHIMLRYKVQMFFGREKAGSPDTAPSFLPSALYGGEFL
jgi:hypothetical protein